ncbi:UDP-glucose 4-epimerase GalE [Micromonospora sp. NBC_01796]|uniref:UDP-glucose 4-epimerase GalE n=1 Tax=Micromonospora sp. NBC_01796 TaxID=2975987 RepID=UPI002DDB5A5C|nr:UDP-glucose 4-epimerase GalE [Micromonospora sp. NBC_01796]WSA86853.1 UDP-glucose 4-epimerase GalE [Micromonospora sp. NBC_01796]
MKVLVAGGAGFIGSTVVSACLDDGLVPVILDNLNTGRREFTRDRIFYQGDIADGALIDRIFADHPDITAVVHAAALIVVPESVAQPLRYYRENVGKSVDFLDHLLRNGCQRVLFSSSAAIYRPGEDFSVDENSDLEPTSPYGRTKAMLETILADTAAATDLRALSLRYFNPIGADPTMRTGLQLRRPSHALGMMISALEKDTEFLVTGVDWPTRDGSGIRDYIHVWDLARAHVQALRRFDDILPVGAQRSYEVINLGTGNGTTVKEFVTAFNAVSDRPLRVRETGPRPGDSAGSYTRTGRARQLLDWKAELTLEDGIRHSLAWAAQRDAVLED